MNQRYIDDEDIKLMLNIFEKIKNKPTNEEVVDEQPIEQPTIDDSVNNEIVEEVVDEVEDKVEDEEKIVERAEEEVVVEDKPIEDKPTNEEIENIIEGYAIVFNELSEDLGGFREIILPEAVTQDLIDNSDIYYLFNHNDETIPLARCNHGSGSLELTIDSKGLKYRFNCLNKEFYELVKRGDLDKSSFAFTLPKDGTGEIWEKNKDYNYIRKITKIEQLYDCSAVLVPAYSATSVYARNLESKQQVEEGYYDNYDSIIQQLEQ